MAENNNTPEPLTAEEVLTRIRKHSIESSIPGTAIKFAHFYKDSLEAYDLIRQYAEQKCAKAYAKLRAELEASKRENESLKKENVGWSDTCARLDDENEALATVCAKHKEAMQALLKEAREVLLDDFVWQTQELEKALALTPADVRDQLAELKAWKESALNVMPDFQAIGKELGITAFRLLHATSRLTSAARRKASYEPRPFPSGEQMV